MELAQDVGYEGCTLPMTTTTPVVTCNNRTYCTQNLQAMELVQDVGYEGAMNYLGRKLVDLPCRHQALRRSAAVASVGALPRVEFVFKDSIALMMPNMAAQQKLRDAASVSFSFQKSSACRKQVKTATQTQGDDSGG